MASTLIEPRAAPWAPPQARTGSVERVAGRPRLVAATLGVWLAGAVIFFWEPIASGFNLALGDDVDARFIVTIQEHWYSVLDGRAAWLDPSFFHPVQGVLGYSETFVLNELFYAPLRAIGADPILAYQLTLIGLSLVGFCSFVALTRRFLRVPLGVALVGAWTFTFANNLAIKAVHAQMYAVCWVPLILYLGAAAWSRRSRPRRRSIVLAAASGALAGLLLLSNYYVAWFSGLTGAVAAVVAALLQPRHAWAVVKDAAGTGWRSLVAFAAALSFGVILFVLTYLPVVRQAGGRSYADALAFAGQVTDLVNVGGGNLLWRDVFDGRFGPTTERLANVEANLAVPPILVVTMLALAVVAGLLHRRRPDRARLGPPLAVVLAITAVVLAVAPVGTEAGSLWAGVWLLPGAHAIRAIFRLQIVNQLVVALAFVAGATAVLAHWPGWRRRPVLLPLAAALAVLLMVEEVNVADYAHLDRTVNRARLAAVMAPPSGCGSFYVTSSGPAVRSWDALQVDAMQVSQKLGVPTINGYSGVFPTGWYLADPHSPTYAAMVRLWVDRESLRGSICGYDMTTHAWTLGAP